MSSEFRVLREAWQALDEPSPEVRDGARARLFQEIAGEESERLGRAKDQKPRRAGLRPRSRFAIVVVFGLLLLLISATLTLALGWHVVFGSAPQVSHSSRIYKDFSTLDVGAPAGMETGVIPNQTRLVTTFGRVRLWVAPTRAGGYCYLMEGAGGCDRPGTVPLSVGTGSGCNDTLHLDMGVLRVVAGAINPRWSETVELRFEDGTVLRPRIVWVSAPISQGFFYVPIGNDHRRAGHQLREVVALNDDGDIVDRDDFMWRAAHGWPPSDTPPGGAAVENAEQVARVETPNGEAVLWRAPSHFETTCTWLSLAGHYYYYLSGCRIKGYPSTPVDLVRLLPRTRNNQRRSPSHHQEHNAPRPAFGDRDLPFHGCGGLDAAARRDRSRSLCTGAGRASAGGYRTGAPRTVEQRWIRRETRFLWRSRQRRARSRPRRRSPREYALRSPD